MDFDGHFILLIPRKSDVEDQQNWSYAFMKHKCLYYLTGRAKVCRRKSSEGDFDIQWNNKDETLLGKIVDISKIFKDVEKALIWGTTKASKIGKEQVTVAVEPVEPERKEIPNRVDPAPLTSLPDKLRQSGQSQFLQSLFQSEKGRAKLMEPLTKEQQRRTDAVDLASRALMTSTDNVGKMMREGHLPKDCPFDSADISRAKLVRGKDPITLGTTFKAKPTHVDKGLDGVSDRRRVYERSPNGVVEDDVLHADVGVIAGRNILCTTFDRLKIRTFIPLADMTTIEACKTITRVVRQHMARGFGTDKVVCDKGTNFISEHLTTSLAMFGVYLDPVPTDKHDGAIESIIDPARSRVMETLRRIATQWGCIPPVDFLVALLTHCGNVQAYQTTAIGNTLSTGQVYFGSDLDIKEVLMPPGSPCIYKVPNSTITKADERGRPGVYLATRVSTAHTAIVYCLVKEKLIEVAFHDIEVIEATPDMRDKLKSIASKEAARGARLNLGVDFVINPNPMSGSTRVTRSMPSDVSTIGERGGEEKGEETPLSPRQEPPNDSFVTNVEWGGLKATNDDETLMTTLGAEKLRDKLKQGTRGERLQQLILKAVESRRLRRKESIAIEKVFSMGIEEATEAYGERAKDSLQKELRNLFKRAFRPVDPKSVDPEYLVSSHALFHMKLDAEGKDTVVKARVAAGGNRQNKDDVPEKSSPTIAYRFLCARESISCFNDETAIVTDVHGAYLHAKQPREEKPIFMALSRKVSDVAVEIWPEFASMRDEKGRLVGKVEYAIYGTLAAGLYWWRTLSGALKEIGYKSNQWEQCLMTRTAGEKKVSVANWVDDQRWHSKWIAMILADIEFLNGKFGKEKRLKVQQSPVTEYLGLIWNRSVKGECLITGPKHIDEMLAGIETTGIRTTPGVEDALSCLKDSPLLPEKRRATLAKLVMKAMYIGKHFRPDILVMAHCISRMITKATEHDWNKLVHLLQYIRGTRDYGLMLRPGNSLALTKYCDSSLGNQYDLASTSGDATYFGACGRGVHNGGNPIDWSTKVQKTRSINSCHAELICLTDSVPKIIEMRNFLIEEGAINAKEPTLIFEDNVSCINIATEGRDAAGPMSRHLDLRAIWFKDYLTRSELRIAHLRTDLMRADLLTKSAQGKQFHQLLPTLVYPDR